MNDPHNIRNSAAEQRANALHAAAAAAAKRQAGIKFRALARSPGVSVNFLYNNPELRRRVEQPRTQQDQAQMPKPTPDAHNAVIHTLTTKLSAKRRRRQDHVALLPRAHNPAATLT